MRPADVANCFVLSFLHLSISRDLILHSYLDLPSLQVARDIMAVREGKGPK